MFPCHKCPKQYIGETSKKIGTRQTEHKNAINRHDPRSLPATRIDENGHKFNWSETKILGIATTKRAQEFKEAWYSIDRHNKQTH